MEKKIYEKPIMQLEAFIANDCVASCSGTEYGKYLFKCNAPKGYMYYYQLNKADGPEPNEWKFPPESGTRAVQLGGYEPCGEDHKTPTKADFYYGFIDYNNNGKIDVYPEGDERDERCIVYTEKFMGFVYDYHGTKLLDQESWPVVKS